MIHAHAEVVRNINSVVVNNILPKETKKGLPQLKKGLFSYKIILIN